MQPKLSIIVPVYNVSQYLRKCLDSIKNQTFQNFVVYLIDDDILASSYEEVDNKFVINNDLSANEYDMIDKVISLKMGEAYA